MRIPVLAAALGEATVTVGDFRDALGPITTSAREIRADLIERIEHGAGAGIRHVRSGGTVTITGTILADSYQEELKSRIRICRATGESAGPISVPAPAESVACSDATRTGRVVIRVEFRAVVGNGVQLVRRVYDETEQRETLGRTDGAFESRPPPALDVDAMSAAARHRLVEQFARELLPWRDSVRVEFEDCADPDCDRAVELFRRGERTASEDAFTRVITDTGSPRTPVAPGRAQIVGRALRNRAIAREYAGRFAAAADDLDRAIELLPARRSALSLEATRLHGMAQYYERVRLAIAPAASGLPDDGSAHDAACVHRPLQRLDRGGPIGDDAGCTEISEDP